MYNVPTQSVAVEFEYNSLSDFTTRCFVRVLRQLQIPPTAIVIAPDQKRLYVALNVISREIYPSIQYELDEYVKWNFIIPLLWCVTFDHIGADQLPEAIKVHNYEHNDQTVKTIVTSQNYPGISVDGENQFNIEAQLRFDTMLTYSGEHDIIDKINYSHVLHRELADLLCSGMKEERLLGVFLQAYELDTLRHELEEKADQQFKEFSV